MTATLSQPVPVPRLVDQFEKGLDAPICLTWELTYACNLSCVHCLSASGRRNPDELTTEQCKAVIDELQRMHREQSESSIYLRYFTYKSELSRKDLERFTHVDHRDRVAFVITRGGRVLGIGRYDRYPGTDAAEVAFNISDAAQGRGLGSILMEHLAVAARENGIRRFTAEVLPENRKMLSVFQESGFEVARHF